MKSADIKYLKLIGKNISRIRKEKGLTQVQVCDDIDMERNNFSGIENGRRNMTCITLKKIADSLDTEVIEFFRFD
ncbi:helix-turn-helix domain-containing protein [Pseudofulvibacter geojedonensis]|uniref:Helix-turn-helix domain-containing protein n=1 Tax=Pseudofulvibacter geojedonensis TaxID=1123758 RepID=A0ABW3I2K5_9FLAO